MAFAIMTFPATIFYCVQMFDLMISVKYQVIIFEIFCYMENIPELSSSVVVNALASAL